MPEISPTIIPSILSEEERKPKFLVSAVTTITTLSTFTICYTAGTLTAPCKKKKREIPSEHEIADLTKDETIQDGQNIDSSRDLESEGKRKGRFLFYWRTTTYFS